MSSTGDSEKTAQRSNRIFGPLFSKKPEGVAHFVDLISETLDVNVPGTSGNTASIPQTPKMETGLKQPNIVEIINIDTDDETNCDPNTSNPRIDDPDNPYTYQCNLNRDKLEKLAEDDSEEMDDDTLKAFLNIIRIESGKPVIVISSHYRKRVLSLGFTKSLYDGNLENFEVALIPIHMPCPEYAHWVLGIYRRNKSILYYDSLGITYGPDESKDGTTLELLTDWVAETLKSAVRDITGDTQLNPKIEAVPLDGPQFDHHSPKHKINPQMDGVNCGFHVALIAEAFVMNNEVVFLEKFDIAVDRTRILDILSGLRNDNYRYIPRDACYAPKDVDLDLGMKQLDVFNASDKVLDSFEYATMENECIEKLATKDEEKAPDNVIEKMSQLVESAESNTLKNDQSKAGNQRQSASPASNSEEAPLKPDQEIEKTEVTTQHICKDTEDPEKPNLETTVQLKTKDDSEKDANESKHDGPKVPEADRTSLLSLQIFSVISIPPMAPLSSSQAENSDQRSEPAKMRASSQETLNIKEIVMPKDDGPKKTPKFTQSKIRSNTVVKEPDNVVWKSDVVPYLTRRFLQNLENVKVNANQSLPVSTPKRTPGVPTEQSSIFQEPKMTDSNRKRPKSVKIIVTPISSKKIRKRLTDELEKCWGTSSRGILESLKASNPPGAESDSRVKNITSLQQEKLLKKSHHNESRSSAISHNDEDLLPSDLDESGSYSCHAKDWIDKNRAGPSKLTEIEENQLNFTKPATARNDNHERIHSGGKRFKCDQCSFTCATSQHLNYHICNHSGERPMKCGQCSYACILTCQLKQHIIKNHSKETK